jgi:hypothetical protein
LLALVIRDGFEVFVTVDRNLSFQQNIPAIAIAVIVLHAPTNRLSDLRTLIPKLLVAIDGTTAGTFTTVSKS